MYKGLSVNLIRTVPNSAVTMLTYELRLFDSDSRETNLALRYELLMRYLSTIY